ncbi:MAG: ATP-binding cassette domain-containing protein, partial [Bacteroidota bacterium]
MVHQELAFCPNLTVAENLGLGSMPSVMGWLDGRALRDRARELLRQVGAMLDEDALVGSLSTGQEQMLQIAAAVGTGARVIVMDEPTSSLSEAESER